jgi:glutamate racemase
MVDSRPIAFLDSGVGGLPYLEWVRSRYPDEHYIYLADNALFPYGTKASDSLRSIIVDRVGNLIRAYGPKIIVVACNTASVVALATLRRTFGVPFVGVVPAVKPAALRSKVGRIGLLATNGTISDAYTDGLIEEFAASCTVTRIGDGCIVEFIENRFVDSDRETRLSALSGAIDRMKQAGIDTLVIGCTHFIYIEDDLREALNGEVTIVDSRDGVGRQIIKILKRTGLNNKGDSTAMLLTTSTADEVKFTQFAELFDLRFGGALGD